MGACCIVHCFLLLEDLGQNLSQDPALMTGSVQPMWSSAIFASSTRFAPGSRSTMLHTVQSTVVGWEVGVESPKHQGNRGLFYSMSLGGCTQVFLFQVVTSRPVSCVFLPS